MKVKELIKKLKTLDENTEVVVQYLDTERDLETVSSINKIALEKSYRYPEEKLVIVSKNDFIL